MENSSVIDRPTNNNDNGYIVAILSYFSFLGFILAYFLHKSSKTKFGAYYLRQNLGFIVNSVVLFILTILIFSDVATILFALIYYPLLILTIISWAVSFLQMAFGDEAKPALFFGKLYENWFSNLFYYKTISLLIPDIIHGSWYLSKDDIIKIAGKDLDSNKLDLSEIHFIVTSSNIQPCNSKFDLISIDIKNDGIIINGINDDIKTMISFNKKNAVFSTKETSANFTREKAVFEKSSNEAITELKMAKDKLELGVILQEEYDILKADLSKYII